MKITEITRCANDKSVNENVDEGVGFGFEHKFPPEFHTWLLKKKLSTGDLAPFRALKESDGLHIFLIQLAKLNPSKSDGTSALEMAVDLTLMGVSLDEEFVKVQSFSDLYIKLKKCRYPLASAQFESADTLVKKLPWPKKASATATRQGDQAGVQVKMFFHSTEELKNQITGLRAVLSELEQNNIKRF